MTESDNVNRALRWLFLLGLVIAGVFAGFEVSTALKAQQRWDELFSAAGLLTIIAFVVILLLGFITNLISSFTQTSFINVISSHSVWVRWLEITILALSLAWFFLYSPWQEVMHGPWLQFMFAASAASLITVLATPHRSFWSHGKQIILTFGLFLYPRVVFELRSLYPQPSFYRTGTVLACLLVLGLIVWLFGSIGARLGNRLVVWRSRLGKMRWLIAALALSGPLILLMVLGPELYITDPAIRFSFFLLDIYIFGIFVCNDREVLISFKALVVSAFALALISALANSLLLVVNYPFSLSWSEGNRFYDYSLMFGQNLYNYSGTIINPNGSPGRYFLWSVLFLAPRLPIIADRLWNVFLLTVPPLLVGWFLARKLEESFTRIGFSLWIGLLFTIDSPLHPPFLVAAIIALPFLFNSSLIARGVSIAVASFYAGASRYTWIPDVAAWGILADLILYYPNRRAGLFKRLTPTLLVAFLGLVPGFISSYRDLPLSNDAPEYHQPLLWYRLLPNPTFPLGVLPATILISGPLLLILLWWTVTRRLKLDWVQLAAVYGAVIGFLAAGLVVSSKIGGGGDLHNLDMYLMTLVLVVGLGFYLLSKNDRLFVSRWPIWLQFFMGLAMIFPLYQFAPFSAGSAYNPLLDLPKVATVNRTLDNIRQQVISYSRQGQVLFMDQRQLLTFGYVDPIPFIPEYEKKYMMNQALADNSAYFQGYYEDLAHKRFALILTEVLTARYQKAGYFSFSDENNAWVKWVSEPTLCFYTPLAVYTDINVELLIPRQPPIDCGMYLIH